jgi:hypothetical protein
VAGIDKRRGARATVAPKGEDAANAAEADTFDEAEAEREVLRGGKLARPWRPVRSITVKLSRLAALLARPSDDEVPANAARRARALLPAVVAVDNAMESFGRELERVDDEDPDGVAAECARAIRAWQLTVLDIAYKLARGESDSGDDDDAWHELEEYSSATWTSTMKPLLRACQKRYEKRGAESVAMCVAIIDSAIVLVNKRLAK